MMIKSLVISLAFFALMIVSLAYKSPVSILFAGIGVYFAFKCLKSKKKAGVGSMNSPEIIYGKLGKYSIDDDILYGLYLTLAGSAVFVDIREDEKIEQREMAAISLFSNSSRLDKDLERFMESYPEYRARKVASIGLHAEDAGQGEVFWDPDGYTILRGFEFRID